MSSIDRVLIMILGHNYHKLQHYINIIFLLRTCNILGLEIYFIQMIAIVLRLEWQAINWIPLFMIDFTALISFYCCFSFLYWDFNLDLIVAKTIRSRSFLSSDVTSMHHYENDTKKCTLSMKQTNRWYFEGWCILKPKPIWPLKPIMNWMSHK